MWWMRDALERRELLRQLAVLEKEIDEIDELERMYHA